MLFVVCYHNKYINSEREKKRRIIAGYTFLFCKRKVVSFAPFPHTIFHKYPSASVFGALFVRHHSPPFTSTWIFHTAQFFSSHFTFFTFYYFTSCSMICNTRKCTRHRMKRCFFTAPDEGEDIDYSNLFILSRLQCRRQIIETSARQHANRGFGEKKLFQPPHRWGINGECE